MDEYNWMDRFSSFLSSLAIPAKRQRPPRPLTDNDIRHKANVKERNRARNKAARKARKIMRSRL